MVGRCMEEHLPTKAIIERKNIMGCDIHAYIESQPHKETSPEYWWKNADLYITRNYAMFGFLAGVRSNDNPLFAPRGWDKNSSTKFEYCLYVEDGDPDGDGNCSSERAEHWVSRGDSERIDEKWVTHPDWHTASWLTADELEKVVQAYREKYPQYDCNEWLGYVELMKRIPESRFTFWFDN